jgi:hypothetical protein
MPNERGTCFERATSSEEIMRTLFIATFLSLVCSPPLFAISHRSNGYQQAKVVSVNRHVTYSPDECCDFNATDAPLESQYYTYDIKVRVGCTTYVVERDTQFDYLPTLVGANGTASVRVTKYYVYFLQPFTGLETKMSVVHHHTNKTGACSMTQRTRSS